MTEQIHPYPIAPSCSKLLNCWAIPPPSMRATILRLLSLPLLLLLASCEQQQIASTSKVFASESHNLTFRYPSTWEPVQAQAKSTLVLLYARDGSLATCNVSVIPSDRDHASDFDVAYFLAVLTKSYEDAQIRRTWQRSVLGQEMAFVECDFTMSMPRETVPMSSLIMATVQDNKRYMMILNSPRDRLSGVQDDFEVMVSSFSFSRPTTGRQTSQQKTSESQMRPAIPVRQQLIAVTLEGRAKPVNLLVPSEFKPASTQSDIATRDRYLTQLHSNPARRTRYCDWMVYDWSTPEKMPWLMVASIGGFIKHQGALPQGEWDRCKAEILALQGRNIESNLAAVEKRIRDGANIDYEITKRQITDLFVSDSSSVTCVLDLATRSEAGPVEAWGAMKMIYTDNSIATVYVYVSKDQPDAFALLQSLSQRVSAR